MADDPKPSVTPLPLDLFEAGDLRFVEAVRACDDAPALADFAARWFDDPRPFARRMLFDYLDRPMNAFHHEGLVKRLFKRAEALGDDALMARFLVLFDRSIRRYRQKGRRRVTGFERPGEVIRHSQLTTMPRGERPRPADLPQFRLFSPRTRGYLRRRAWRYFRKIGKVDPRRYVAAVSVALSLYTDDDTRDRLALIDNWGLVHILFHQSPDLVAKAGGWWIRPGHTLFDLAQAPIFDRAWRDAPAAVAGLLMAKSRTVRVWAVRRLQSDLPLTLAGLTVVEWAGLLGHADPDVVALAAEVLRPVDDPAEVDADLWLALAESTSPMVIDVVADFLGRHLSADRVTLGQAARLAGLAPVPLARLGFGWLMDQRPKPGDDDALLLGLIDAKSAPVRPRLLRWLRGVFADVPAVAVEFLHGRHADARIEGWAWFRSEPKLHDDPETWRILLQSPHDDVRLAMVAELESRRGTPRDLGRSIHPEGLRTLCANVLLNVNRGSRAKPGVVRMLTDRIVKRPGEAEKLLPLLGLAMRSSRAPERRAGLVAVMAVVEGRPELAEVVRSSFPELQWDGSPAIVRPD